MLSSLDDESSRTTFNDSIVIVTVALAVKVTVCGGKHCDSDIVVKLGNQYQRQGLHNSRVK